MSFTRSLCLGMVGFLLFFCLLLFGATLTFKTTLLQPQFFIKESGKLDISIAAREYLADQFQLDATYLTATEKTLVDLDPWIKEQISAAISSTCEYLLGKSKNFRIKLELDPFRQSLAENLVETYLETSPPEYRALPAAGREAYLARLRQDTLDFIPASLEINKENLGDDAMAALGKARQAAAILNILFWGLLAAVIILAFLLVMILRRGGAILLSLGIIFLACGALVFPALLMLKSVLIPGLMPAGLVPEIQIWISETINDILSPWRNYGISLAAAGVVLLLIFGFISLSARRSAGQYSLSERL